MMWMTILQDGRFERFPTAVVLVVVCDPPIPLYCWATLAIRTDVQCIRCLLPLWHGCTVSLNILVFNLSDDRGADPSSLL